MDKLKSVLQCYTLIVWFIIRCLFYPNRTLPRTVMRDEYRRKRERETRGAPLRRVFGKQQQPQPRWQWLRSLIWPGMECRQLLRLHGPVSNSLSFHQCKIGEMVYQPGWLHTQVRKQVSNSRMWLWVFHSGKLTQCIASLNHYPCAIPLPLLSLVLFYMRNSWLQCN